MLKQRVVTAIVLTVLIFSAVLFFPHTGFQLFIGAFWVIASWEWARLSGLQKKMLPVVYALCMTVLMYVVIEFPEVHVYLLLLSLLWWLIAFYFVLVYPHRISVWSPKPVMLLLGVLVLLPSWVALIQLRSHEYFLFLFLLLFLIVTSADIGAFFTGRALGKNKLAPEVSPNKTWEGFWGGVGLSLLVATVFTVYLYTQGYIDSVIAMVLIIVGSIIMASLSVVGDLFESMCKRRIGIKDSGSILPGHGGILDRIDSVTAAAPIYILILLTLETLVL